MDWIDTKYTRLLSGRLERFKEKNSVFNFRCPLCGDSEKKNKARGYILSKGNRSTFFCHNCNASMSLGNFIKFVDPLIYSDYIKDKMFEDKPNIVCEAVEEKKDIDKTPFKNIRKISQLPLNHPARLYVESRKIPTRYHYKLYFCREFQAFTNTLIPNKFEKIVKDEPRLIIALMDENKNIFGYQGRSFRKKTDLRYITIMLDESRPKIFGLDNVDFTKPITVFEGPIDSMMLSNSLASCDGYISKNLDMLDVDKDIITVVYDNEPRNEQIVNNMLKTVRAGYKICVWPDSINEKDANEMVMNGLDPFDLRVLIKENTYKGLDAELKIAEWRKI